MTTRREPAGGADAVVRVVAVLAALAPIVVATARAVRSGWLPIGDNALFQIRAQDVLTRHHPLVGTWTSASQSIGIHINNPGPLLFDLLAAPTKIGGASGLAVGVAILNASCVVAIAWVAGRRAGTAGVLLAMATTTGLLWTLGSELLFDPWQPHSLLLPFLLLLATVWSLVDGDIVALPIAAFLVSLIVETHLSYVVLLAFLSATGVLGLTLALRRRRTAAPDDWPTARRHLRRSVAATAIVVAACWVQPLVDQFDADGHGNLGHVITRSGGGGAAIGVPLATRLVGSILALPPFWGRPSFAEGLAFLGDRPLPGAAAAGAALALLGVLLAGGLVAARRRHDATAAAALVVSVVALVAAYLTTVLLPVGSFAVAPHQLRWLWPIAVFTTFALALAVARPLGTAHDGGGRAVRVAALAATLLLSALALPAWNARTGPAADADTIPTARALVAQLAPLEGKGPLVYDIRTLRFAEPYSVPVMAELQHRGVEFRLDEEGMVHQFGRSRAADGTEHGTLYQREGEAAATAPEGGVLIAHVEGLPPAERAELERLRATLTARIAADGLRLDDGGRKAVALGAVRGFGDPDAPLRRAEPFIRSYDFVRLVHDDLTDAPAAWRSDLVRYADLLEVWLEHTVALYLVPAPAR